ncbi:MAG TPA: gliding motility-associated C-terminal domain-containing protein, partial [Bacteroidia bacterium]|nr:gliding motility-associated C-terminal domain-containing protein [Bacteroidia bacterium]
FCIIGLMAKSSFVTAQVSAPQIYCIAVDSAGTSATVTWKIPPDTNNTFVSYNINNSTSAGSGYTPGPPVSPDNINSCTITGINAAAAPVYFSGVTNYKTGVSGNGDTVESIYLSVSNLGGVALLQWNSMHTPNLPGFNGWYKIYREYPQYVWTLVDSIKSNLSLMTYNDTIKICSASLSYKIVVDNSFGCQSVSNRSNPILFKDIIVPATPVMDTVSVGPGGNVEISWSKSTSSNTIGYLLYEYINNKWVVIDSLTGINSTHYTLAGNSGDSASLSFCVAAFDSCNNLSPYSSPQHTIFLKDVPDKCAQENTLEWNAYVNLTPGIGKYVIYESVNGGKFTELASTDSVKYVQTGLNTIETLCYYVRVKGAKDSDITATSNIICYQTTLPPPPKFSYLQTATVINNSTQNQVNWYVDTGAGLEHFIIKREDSLKGQLLTVGTVNAASHKVFYSFVDPTADPNSMSYIYKVYDQDSCNYITDSTNIGQTIYLTAVGNSTGQNVLNWNGYQAWQNGVSSYSIYRNEDSGPFSLIGTLPGTSHAYTDDVSTIITGQGIFCYYIKAVEIPPSYPFVDTSVSNIACAYQDPRLYIPNAFNPKGVNQIFKPVGVFVDLQNYDFTIYNRWGQLIFETTDVTKGWDGTYSGHMVEEGVYIYRIVYTSGKGEYFDKKGWVMMLK